MPYAYRVISWLVLIYIILITGWVWYIAYSSLTIKFYEYQAEVWTLNRLLLTYHGILLVISFLGWGMQELWRRAGTLALFPLSMVLGSVLLNIIALQMFFILQAR